MIFLRIFYFQKTDYFDMKQMVVVIGLIVLVIAGATLLPQKNIDVDYLRLHIRANSNSSVDQDVKYEVKNAVVEFLSPVFCTVESKEKAIELVNSYSASIKAKCEQVLKSKGFNYSVNIKVDNEFFPTRTYANTTLESGCYDAVIIELGQAQGDNWWCVMYPPLCFVNKNENINQIKYKSKIYEWFQKVFA